MYTIKNDKITVTVIPTTTTMSAIVFNRFSADIYIYIVSLPSLVLKLR